MLSTLRSTLKNSPVPFGRIVTRAAAVIMSARLIAPVMAQQQASERQPRELSEATGMRHEQLGVYGTIVRDRLEREAKATLSGAQATLAANQTKVDASAAKTAIAGLSGFTKLGDDKPRTTIDQTKAASDALPAPAPTRRGPRRTLPPPPAPKRTAGPPPRPRQSPPQQPPPLLPLRPMPTRSRARRRPPPASPRASTAGAPTSSAASRTSGSAN